MLALLFAHRGLVGALCRKVHGGGATPTLLHHRLLPRPPPGQGREAVASGQAGGGQGRKGGGQVKRERGKPAGVGKEGGGGGGGWAKRGAEWRRAKGAMKGKGGAAGRAEKKARRACCSIRRAVAVVAWMQRVR